MIVKKFKPFLSLTNSFQFMGINLDFKLSNNKEKKNNLVLPEESQNNKKEYPESALIDQIRDGNHSAFSEIIRRYESKIATTVYGILGQSQEAEDVGQEVFIRFFKSINYFKGESELGTYLTRIAINLSINELKRRKRRRFISIDDWIKTDSNAITENSEVDKIEKKELVQKALSSLELKFKSVVVLRLINGYSTVETAKILNIPIGTVLSRLSRAQRKMKKILTPYMVEL